MGRNPNKWKEKSKGKTFLEKIKISYQEKKIWNLYFFRKNRKGEKNTKNNKKLTQSKKNMIW